MTGEEQPRVSPPPGDGPLVETLIPQIQEAINQHRLGQARQLVRQGLAQCPDHGILLDFMGYVSFFLGDYATTESSCRRALALRPEHAYAMKGMGLALARQGRVDDGMQWLQRAIEKQPDWADPYWDLACVQLEANQMDQALETVRRAEAAVPAGAERMRALRDAIVARQAGR